MEQNSQLHTERKKILEELSGVTLVFSALFLLLALYSFDDRDPVPLLQTAGARLEIANKLGWAGAFLAGYARWLFGWTSYYLPALLTWFGLKKLFPLLGITRRHWVGLSGLFLASLLTLGSNWFDPFLKIGVRQAGGLPGSPGGLVVSPGGLIGSGLYGLGARIVSPIGMYLLVTFLAVASVQLFLGISWEAQTTRAKNALVAVWAMIGPGIMRFLFGPGRPDQPAHEDELDESYESAATADSPSSRRERGEGSALKGPARAEKSGKPKSKPVRQERPGPGVGGLPPLSLLTTPPSQTQGPPEDFLRAQAASLITCLGDFGIQGEVVRIMPGPVVTMYEIKPAPGVKVSRIAGLANDIALAMKAMAVRIEAPIPGRDTVGVEIPNVKRQTVYLREVLESEAFTASPSRLTLSVGKDIQGIPYTADLSRMPHLLVAGATGSGKSVCINGILLSILYKAQPHEVKLMLIDPKRIELAMYADLPHLVHPVVTDMNLAKSALEWCLAEMDRRYEAMAQLGVRNLDGYNEKAAKLAANPQPDTEAIEPLPYLVLVIDELADLMMTAAKEVEIAIVRLAQLARAAGIHMILATQRPSVDVVTGLIKANFPTRIAFQVTSRHDSRTILDTGGAEHLLGRGDMLFKPSGSKMVRMHGAFVSDEESSRVVEYWKERQAPSYLMDLASWAEESSSEGGTFGAGGDGESLADPVYPQALDFVMEQGKASISLIQRRFRIGFNRAARFIEQMERDGLLGPADGSKPRVVLKGRE
jgi:S-DNA-T family DNA segregation ATPase FtsK/SpoIIIE